jgi:hypothetical protein
MKRKFYLLIVIFACIIKSGFIFGQEKLDSRSLKKVFTHDDWLMYNVCNFDIGYGNMSKLKNDERISGFQTNWEILNFVVGSSGWGLGSSFYEINSWNMGQDSIGFKNSATGIAASWFPLYVYIPLYLSEKRLDINNYGHSYILLYTGGSAWGTNKNKYLFVGAKAGLGMVFKKQDGKFMAGGIYCKTGIFANFNEKIKNRIGYLFTIGYSLGGVRKGNDF